MFCNKKKLIDNYSWWIDIHKWNSTFLKVILGPFPHEVYPYAYSVEDYFVISKEVKMKLCHF